MAKLKDGFQGECAIVLPGSVVHQMETDPFCRNLHVTDIGYYPNAKYHFRERKEPISQYILIYCTRGAGWYQLGGGPKVPRRQRPAFRAPGRQTACLRRRPARPMDDLLGAFQGRHGRHVRRRAFGAVQHPLRRRLPNIDQARNFRRDIPHAEERLQQRQPELLRRRLLYYFLGTIKYLGKYRESHEAQKSEHGIVETAVHFMRENLGKKLTLADIARHVNYSPSYFSAVFSKRTGYAPVNYFNQLKIQQACTYLDFTDMKISQICPKLGIDDPYYFSRLFTKHMGMSPSDYKKYKKG